MKSENLKLKIILTGVFLITALAIFSAYQYIKFNDGRLHLVFCNVGQGDGIFIRTPKGLDILVDGGPNDSILSCLSNHMPFWDRTIELMFLSHPHADHMRGLMDVLKRYKVLSFSTEKLENDTVLYREMINKIQKLKVKTQNLTAGDRFKTRDGVMFKILGPSEEFIERTSPTALINESSEFASLIILLSYKNEDILLTGDSQISGLEEAIKEVSSVKVLQVPHHGSRFGLDQNILNKLNPKLAVISVGKNKYGHPSIEVLKLLEEFNIKTLRTDKNGEVEIVVNSKGKFYVTR